jgi:hypothetical protein
LAGPVDGPSVAQPANNAIENTNANCAKNLILGMYRSRAPVARCVFGDDNAPIRTVRATT